MSHPTPQPLYEDRKSAGVPFWAFSPVRNDVWDSQLVIDTCVVLGHLVTHGSCPSAQQTLVPSSRKFSLRAHPFTPLGEEPALCAGSHVTVLNVIWPELHVAFLIIHHIPDVAHTLHIAGPLSHSTGHRALKHSELMSAAALGDPPVTAPSSLSPATRAEGCGEMPLCGWASCSAVLQRRSPALQMSQPFPLRSP